MEEAWQFAMTYLIFFRILTSQDTTPTPQPVLEMEPTTWHMLGQLLPLSQGSQCGFFLFFLSFSLYLFLTNFTPPSFSFFNNL